MATVMIDSKKQEQFGERLLDVLNSGALTLMLSLGQRTGLLDTMSELPPATSQEIADAAKLNERYVREWLGAMTVGGIVTVDPRRERYFLPREHAAFLTTAAGADNVAALSQYIPLLAAVEDKIVHCFKHGGGVPYKDFGRFHDVMAQDSGQSVVPALFDHILPLVPGMTGRLAQGIDVLDLGCGRGLALLAMAEAFPASRFIGYEFSQDVIDEANADARSRGLQNIHFAFQDAATMAEDDAYDFICTFDAIHDQARPDRVLANIHRALKPGGYYLMQDIRASKHVHRNADHPIGALLYTVSCMHCMTVSLAQDGMGLGTCWGEETALEMLADAGFDDVTVHRLAHDIQNQYYVCPR